MNLHHYHPETKEYLGATPARLDPLETKRQGREVYLVPANATLEAPPEAKAGEVPVFGGKGWVPVENHRGKTAWDTADASPVIIEDLGPVPKGMTLLPPCPFPAWDGEKWIEDAVKRRAAEDAATAARLAEIDRESIRGLRETVATMRVALDELQAATTIAGIKAAMAKIVVPAQVITHEAEALAEREKLG